MSSRIFRPDDGVQTEPIAWRPAGGPTTAAHRAHADTKQAAVPEARLSELQQETEARVRAAYNQGLAAGEAAAQQKAQQKVDPLLASLNGLLLELASLRKRVRAEIEHDTMQLAIAIARRVLYRELSTDPDAILGLVNAAFHKLNARETHRLRLSPVDAAVVQENRAKLQMPPGLEIAADAAFLPGSVVFETSRGDLDASIDTQLAEIDRGLTDVLKRRK